MKKLVIATLISLSFSTSVISTPAAAAHPMCGKTELAEVMGSMKDTMKQVKKAMKSGDIAKLTAIGTQLLADVKAGYDFVPLTISDSKSLNAAQQADFKKYQKGMKFLEQAATELSQATSLDQAKAALGKISKASKQGHKAFKIDCDD